MIAPRSEARRAARSSVEVRARRAGRRARWRSPRRSSTPASASAVDRVGGVDAGGAGRPACPTARPSRTSMATAIRSAPCVATRRPAKAGSRSAAVPTTARAAPAASAAATDGLRRAGRRRPRPRLGPRPPRRSPRSTAPCAGAPVRAPSRSTTWSHRAPAVGERARDRDRIVARTRSRASKSPCSRRTTRPPRRSIAGRISKRACHRHVTMLPY